MREELGVPVLERGVLYPWDVGPSDSMYFSAPKQVVASSEPNFWTNSLQIHCNGPDPKTETLQILLLSRASHGHNTSIYIYFEEQTSNFLLMKTKK